jgi:hypothetical protein
MDQNILNINGRHRKERPKTQLLERIYKAVERIMNRKRLQRSTVILITVDHSYENREPLKEEETVICWFTVVCTHFIEFHYFLFILSKTILFVFCSGLRPFVEPPSVEDSPGSSAEQEQASSDVTKSRVSGTRAPPPPIRDDGSLDYDGIHFILYFVMYLCQKKFWITFYMNLILVKCLGNNCNWVYPNIICKYSDEFLTLLWQIFLV